MPKDVNRDSVVIRALKSDNSQNNISKKEHINEISAKNNHSNVDKSFSIDLDRRRLNKLRYAIGSGRFVINPTRVAEKLIQFETQLSA